MDADFQYGSLPVTQRLINHTVKYRDAMPIKWYTTIMLYLAKGDA